jgi:hypothetical protein
MDSYTSNRDQDDRGARYAASLSSSHRALIDASTTEEFDNAFGQIMLEAVQGLERSSKRFHHLDEDALSDILALALQNSGLLVTREESSNGHADFTFRSKYSNPPRITLGEAKIYDGYAYHIKGLTQLLTRYTTGREARSLLLSYVKKPKIKQLMEKLRQEMDSKLPCEQTAACTDHPAAFSYLSTHEHSSGQVMEVWHLGCNLHHPEAR